MPTIDDKFLDVLNTHKRWENTIQLEIESAGLVSWANPRQCTYEKCYDSFARQFTTTLKVSLGEE